ncbi:hypothetical protein G7085_12405 [Tessaracoccus sp. HDW20]|uniref:hypothetical protein n=1 Tax=Tessaracoccus coleopterorum TaxID=2714950 RepID=UPI0018D33B0B|nr:hypothetical protein [Tessaracoccus coleopterorum]NHB85147.1 hypothetical protein [Tessaracoccus coleopterorum]
MTTLIHENAKNRSREEAWSATSFKAPAATCSIKVQLLTYSYAVTNTTAWYDDVELREADELGVNLKPSYELRVHEEPTTVLTLTGTGTVQVQGWYGGRWQDMGEPVTLDGYGADVTVPELWTGRNININYHDGHVSELQRIAQFANARKLSDTARLLDDTAYTLSRMSVSVPYVPGNLRSTAEPTTITLDMGTESVQVPAEPKPLAIQPPSVPDTMELPDEAS